MKLELYTPFVISFRFLDWNGVQLCDRSCCARSPSFYWSAHILFTIEIKTPRQREQNGSKNEFYWNRASYKVLKCLYVLAYLVVFISQTLSNSSNRTYLLASWLCGIRSTKIRPRQREIQSVWFEHFKLCRYYDIKIHPFYCQCFTIKFDRKQIFMNGIRFF